MRKKIFTFGIICIFLLTGLTSVIMVNAMTVYNIKEPINKRIIKRDGKKIEGEV